MKKCKLIIFTLFLLVIFLLPKNVQAVNKVIDANTMTPFTRTKQDIQNLWKSSNLKIESGYSIYTVEPSDKSPYKGGVVKQEYLNRVLANLNYYRYLIGSPKITTQMKNREDLQAATVLQSLSLRSGNQLTHELRPVYKKPNDMPTDFYNKGVDASHNIISSYGYGAPVFPFFGESYFTYTSGHRTSLLSPTTNKVEFGLGRTTYGDTNSSYSNYNNMQSSIAAYPSPGYFPKQDFSYDSDWDIYLNMNKFSPLTDAEKEKVVVKIKSVKENKTYTYTIKDKNLCVMSSIIHIQSPQKTDSYYEGNYEVYVSNLKDKSGNFVDLKYTVKFFDKYEGITSNIKEITYGKDTSEVMMDGAINKNLIQAVLPKTANVRLESGSINTISIKNYEIIDPKTNSYYKKYVCVPKFNNLPNWVKDKNGLINKGIEVYIRNSNYEDFKYTKDNYVGKQQNSITLSVAPSSNAYANYSHFTWYKEKNNVIQEIKPSNKYTMIGTNLTIKNLTYDDEALYYIVNKTDIPYLCGDSIYISKGLKVTIEKPITKVSLNKTKLSINKGTTSTLTATITPVNTTQSKAITWTTSNKAVATVDSKGKVKAISPGTATITAKTSNGKTAKCVVTVPKTTNQTTQPSKPTQSNKTLNVSYRTHVQNVGWQNYVQNGKMSGTSGRSLRLEGINIKLENNNYGGGITYQTHVQNIGWQNYVQNGAMSGTSGKCLRLEGIRIKLTGEIAKHYDVYYRVHCQNLGWLDWAKNGEDSGSQGYCYRLEGIEVRLVKKGAKAPGKTNRPFVRKYLYYQTHVQNVGWQGVVRDKETSGTSGKSLRLEGIKISLDNPKYNGNIEYRTHVQNIGWQKYVKNGTMSGTSGKALRLEAIQIRLTGELAKKYDIYYRVHCQNFGWMGWAKNGQASGSAGYCYRLEGIQICLVEKGAKAPGSTANCFKSK